MKIYAERSEAKKFWNLKNKHTFYFNNHSQIFSLCLKIFPCVKAKFPVFSLSGKSKNQIPCFPCAVATLEEFQYQQASHDSNLTTLENQDFV